MKTNTEPKATTKNPETKIELRVEKYLKIVQWLRKRYTKTAFGSVWVRVNGREVTAGSTENGVLEHYVAGKPTKYKRLEELAWRKYMLNITKN
jgi:hypothetical protein